MTWLHVVIDVPHDTHASAADFWGEALGWPLGEPWRGHLELASFEPPAGSAYVHLQRVDAAPRVHLDVETEDPGAAVARCVDAGAEVVGRQDGWQTLCSPGGLLFCVLDRQEREVPPPVTWPAGHRTRLVQVCVDSPREAHDREVEFWRGLLGERWFGSDAEEFAGKWYDDEGGPLQLLFQRLEEESGPVRAHLDLGTDDLAGEVRRLVALGATDVAPGRGWHVLRDPTGQVFCATGNSPEVTRHRDLS